MDGVLVHEDRAMSGWYPDPSGMAQLRFFDGSAWTDQVTPPA
jgi:hypothetical protein